MQSNSTLAHTGNSVITDRRPYARTKHMSSAAPTYIDRHFTALELLADHRERLALEEEERARKRTSQFEELRSEVNAVPVRIRAWEKMHGLRLPSDPAHPILRVIASNTGISLASLREEQQARAASSR
jgi:hypothetical protein